MNIETFYNVSQYIGHHGEPLIVSLHQGDIIYNAWHLLFAGVNLYDDVYSNDIERQASELVQTTELATLIGTNGFYDFLEDVM